VRPAAALLASALLFVPMLTGCAANADTPLTVYAAASLRDALGKLQEAYGPLTTSLGGSNALRVQIEQGAPADVFLSADAEQVDQLAAKGHVDGEPLTFAHNSLVLVTPLHDTRVGDWRDLALPGVEVVAAGKEVPIQRYADQLVTLLARRSDAPTGFAAAVDHNVVSREDNVAAVLARMELGEGDAAFVYDSDARGTQLRRLPLPEDVPATYVGAAVRGGNTTEAHRFLEWLTGPQAQQILREYGFSGT
jgi:molybdate transport system substrate-binding protein